MPVKRAQKWMAGIFLFIAFLSMGTFSGNFFLASTIPKVECTNFLPGCGKKTETDFRKNSFFSDILPRFVNWIIGFTFAGGVLMGVISGTMFVFGGADEELRGRAQKTLTYSLLGILLSLFAYFIVSLISNLSVFQS